MNDLLSTLASTRRALTVKEVANMLRISEQTVYRAASRGTIPSSKIGGSIRFNPASVAAYLRSLGAA